MPGPPVRTPAAAPGRAAHEAASRGTTGRTGACPRTSACPRAGVRPRAGPARGGRMRAGARLP
ncbi:Adenylate cyclase [Streptomyces murinus]